MGKPKQTIIEINGKRYDARTGKLLSGSATVVAAKKTSPAPAKTKRTMSDIARPAAKPVRKQPERSQTLMRSAVKKPVAPPKARKVRTVSDFGPVRPAQKPQPLNLATRSDQERVKRAHQIKQSKLVSKFSDHKTDQHPIEPLQPVSSRAETMTTRPAPLTLTSPVSSMLERGLKAAQSHTETYKPSPKTAKSKKKRRTKLATVSAGALAALLLVGFVAYQNIPNISLRYAAARAGVTASLPGYKPAGFALDNRVHYNPGQITVNFSSNADEREFSITQRETAWNSETLLSNYVSTKTDQVQKYEDKGRTIFLYGENNATWVNGGVWYDIEGDSQLNSDQLIRIATSM